MPVPEKKIGIAADHGGFELKNKLMAELTDTGYELIDFGAYKFDSEDDFPDYITPLALAVAKGQVYKGIAVCGSGVGAGVAANKIAGVRAALITDPFSAHQGVEDDDMNIMCLGGRVTGFSLALELIRIFLNARFMKKERFIRRLGKISELENRQNIRSGGRQK
jgi:ribose 5-phosphate isomerase B